MLRSKNVKQVVPNPDDWHVNDFVSCEIEKEEVPVYDAKGNFVRKDLVNKRVYKPYDKDAVAHKGISCELFSLENQLNAGVALQPFNGSFIAPDLSDSSNMGEEAIAAMQARLQVEKENNVEFNNVNE